VQQALHAWAKYVLQIECADEEWRDLWIENANVYLAFERLADIEIGRVLAKLEERPEIASNTIVIFTADHGDYCGSHGLLGKGWGAYEESIRVPFIVRDPTGNWAKQTAVDRPQLTSLVDLYGLMLTLASGGNSWRGDPAYAHLADRLDVGAILQNPDAPGRDYVLHTCDEKLFPVLEGMPAEIPDHVTCIRTADAKLGVYSHWLPESIEVAPHGQDFELYDYATQAGRLELSNEFRTKPALFNSLHARLVNDAVPNELRRPLPSHLMDAYERGIAFDREGRAGRATEAFGTPLTLHSK